jgi:uridine phosphorylase
MARDSIPAPIHLRPHAAVAERVILPGDPGRALRLAQLLIEAPKMLNHNRGLWGYTGEALDGSGPLTVQSSGMGGPSAAIVVEELAMLGARRIVRAGTCGALVDLELGSLLTADRVIGEDGTSRALGVRGPQAPDAALTAALPVDMRGTVVTRDLFYDDTPFPDGMTAVEMEAAAVLAVAARRGIAAACVLCVSDRIGGGARERIEPDALLEAEAELGRAAFAALRTG